MHDGEKIVEVVRDAAGELADGLHFLRLAQQFFYLSRASFSASSARVRSLTASSRVSVKLRSSTSSRLRSVTSMLTPTTRTGFPAAS